MTADDYVKIHDMEETGQTLDDKDILKLVAVDNPDVLVNGDDEDGTIDDGISDLVRNDVTLGKARPSLETLISYFEQTSMTFTSDDNDINMKALDNLWKILRSMEDGRSRESKQKKLQTFSLLLESTVVFASCINVI